MHRAPERPCGHRACSHHRLARRAQVLNGMTSSLNTLLDSLQTAWVVQPLLSNALMNVSGSVESAENMASDPQTALLTSSFCRRDAGRNAAAQRRVTVPLVCVRLRALLCRSPARWRCSSTARCTGCTCRSRATRAATWARSCWWRGSASPRQVRARLRAPCGPQRFHYTRAVARSVDASRTHTHYET